MDTYLGPVVTIGVRSHVTVQVSKSLGSAGVTLGRQVLAGITPYYSRLKWWFGQSVRVDVPTTIGITSFGNGAGFRTGGSFIYSDVSANGKPPYSRQYPTLIWVMEATEVFAATSGLDWTSDWSHGEALSRVVGRTTMGGVLAGITYVDRWLNGGRPDWITRSNLSETEPVPIGCASCFLFWLHHKSKIEFPRITATQGATLEAKYRLLTGKRGGYQAMMRDVNALYPPGKPSAGVDNIFQ